MRRYIVAAALVCGFVGCQCGRLYEIRMAHERAAAWTDGQVALINASLTEIQLLENEKLSAQMTASLAQVEAKVAALQILEREINQQYQASKTCVFPVAETAWATEKP